MPRNAETPKIDRTTKIPDDLDAVFYNMTNVSENFGKKGTSKRIEKLEKIFNGIP